MEAAGKVVPFTNGMVLWYKQHCPYLEDLAINAKPIPSEATVICFHLLNTYSLCDRLLVKRKEKVKYPVQLLESVLRVGCQ